LLHQTSALGVGPDQQLETNDKLLIENINIIEILVRINKYATTITSYKQYTKAIQMKTGKIV
jgi:hypothetical protein